jgi:hypothetical protein
MKTFKKDYSIPQEILYTICIAAWKLCSQNLAKFMALKAFYTEAFIADAVLAIQNAKKLPETVETISARKEARINLIKATRQVLANWQVLKVYITKAYDEKMVKTKLVAAGASTFRKASVDNWTAVRSLIDTANTFIANELNSLTANENMPADFQTTFKTAGDSCIALSVIYTHVNMEKEIATSIKTKANNAVYASLMEMLKDGQQIFKENAEMKKQFTFRYLVSKQRGEHSASLKGKIVNNLNMPVAGAVIVSQDEKYMATTDSKGQYQIKRIAAGTYTFTISCSGYETIVETITCTAGIASRGDFEMTGILKKVA